MNESLNKFPSKIILWGGTGQAKMVRPIIEHYGSKIVAVFDDTPNLQSPFQDILIYHGWDQFLTWIKTQERSEIGFGISIGNPHGQVRLKLHEQLINEGLKAITLAHPSATISEHAIIGEGTQVMAGAIIQPDAKLGKQCIINANTYIDHEVTLQDGVELVAGAQVMGISFVGRFSTIGARSVVLSRLRLGENVEIAAGCIVDKSIQDNNKYFQISERVQ